MGQMGLNEIVPVKCLAELLACRKQSVLAVILLAYGIKGEGSHPHRWEAGSSGTLQAVQEGLNQWSSPPMGHEF